MKTRIFTSALVALFSVSIAFAGNPRTKMFSNTDVRDNGSTKEYMFVDDNMRPETRSVYEYSTAGSLLEKTVYIWNTEKGWIAIQKYNYEYSGTGQISNMIYTEWDNGLAALSPKSQLQVNDNSLLMAEK